MNFLEKHSNVVQWLSGLGLPIAIVISSWFVSTSVEKTKVDSDYVRLAVGILSNDLTNDENKAYIFSGIPPERKAMRQWAIRVLDAKSPVKLTEEEKKAFIITGIDSSLLFSTTLSEPRAVDIIRALRNESNKTLKSGAAEDGEESLNKEKNN